MKWDNKGRFMYTIIVLQGKISATQEEVNEYILYIHLFSFDINNETYKKKYSKVITIYALKCKKQYKYNRTFASLIIIILLQSPAMACSKRKRLTFVIFSVNEFNGVGFRLEK